MNEELARPIEEYVNDNFVEYIDKLKGCDSLQQNLRILVNRAKEYKIPSFVVLVVGPVKSGKSTFVNLLARQYVSPTHFLECTIRPSIISVGANNTSSLSVYRINDNENRMDPMNLVLDCINGLIESEDIKGIDVTDYALTNDNIEEYVRVTEVNSNVLLTSIKTISGGNLLSDNVFVVDMPGFDGSKANFDDVYRSIVERADLFIFVQSSNSAISKISTDFFKLVGETNSSAPVCLLHNVFEAAFWQPERDRNNIIEEQKLYAKNLLTNQYRLSVLGAYALNLGKVNDFISNQYENEYHDVLEEATKSFEKVESEMYKLLEGRTDIRIKNCIVRLNISKEKLLKEIDRCLVVKQEILQTYQAECVRYNNLKRNDITINIGNIAPTVFNNIANQEMNIILNQLGNGVTRVSVARRNVNRVLKRIELNILTVFNNFRKNCYNAILIGQNIISWKQEISAELGIRDFNIIGVNFNNTTNFTVNLLGNNINQIDINLRIAGWGLRWDTTLRTIYNGIKTDLTNQIIPSIVSDMQTYLQNEINTEIEQQIITQFNNEIDRLKEDRLKVIIPDKGLFDREKQSLETLKEKVQNIPIPADLIPNA